MNKTWPIERVSDSGTVPMLSILQNVAMMNRWANGLAALVLNLVLTVQAVAQQSPATQRLAERNKMFEPQIIEVAEGVYTAIGYQVSSNTMIVGDDGVVIVDPGLLPQMAARVRQEFEKISDKPIKAIIYTHGHADHTNGAGAFFDESSGVEVWQRSNYDSEANRNRETGLVGGVRASNTQGFDLREEQRMGIGIAIPPSRPPSNNMMVDGAGTSVAVQQPVVGTVPPTHLFSEERRVLNIAGISIELVKAPGETDDHLYAWLPEQRVLFAGDNFYQSWPNTYPLRGTARRSVRDWIESLGKMIDEDPLVVVGGHTTPMDNAVEVLTNYRNALKWVHDRTLEGAATHMTPDELVEYAALPDEYADLDYLGEYYGSVWGTVRDIYAQDLGWFDGNPLNLHRETPVRQAQRAAGLAGGVAELMQRALDAMTAGDEIGAAQLAWHVTKLQPEDPEAWQLLGESLAIIGEKTFNAPARNYTMSSSNRYLERADELRAQQ